MSRLIGAMVTASLLLACQAPYRTQTRMEHGVLRAAGQPAVVGRVVDAATGKPLRFLVLSLDSFPLGQVDTNGYYELPYVKQFAEGQHEVRIDWRPYRSQRKPFTLRKGFTDTVNFTLEHGPSPCCRLQGVWQVTLVMDSAAALGPPPSARRTGGTVAFSDSLRPSDFQYDLNGPMTHEVGRFDIDLVPFFGGPVAQDVSTTVFGPGTPDLLRETVGSVFAGDSVSIDFIPRMSHGGLSLQGLIRGDSAAGTWIQRAYCCGARGSFVMWRVP